MLNIEGLTVTLRCMGNSNKNAVALLFMIHTVYLLFVVSWMDTPYYIFCITFLFRHSGNMPP